MGSPAIRFAQGALLLVLLPLLASAEETTAVAVAGTSVSETRPTTDLDEARKDSVTAGGGATTDKTTAEESASSDKATADESTTTDKATAEESTTTDKATAEESVATDKANAEESVATDKATAEESVATDKATAEESVATDKTTAEEGATTAKATEAANNTTTAAEATAESNSTAAEGNTTAAATTTAETTTTEEPPPVSAKLQSQLVLTSLNYQPWMELGFTQQYTSLAMLVEELAGEYLRDHYGDDFEKVKVTGFLPGVTVKLDVTVTTDKTRGEDVDAEALAAATTAALQNLVDEGGYTFNPDGVQTSKEIEIIEPTTPPAPTEDPYKYTVLRLQMTAPFVNWTDELNVTDSDAFADIDKEIRAGVDLMVSKKYPKDQWNVSSNVLYMHNATDYDDDDEGITITFVVMVQPQMANTSKTLKDLATSFVYFNKMGELQIDPSSVRFKDLSNYAPAQGVVIMDEDYLRELRKTKYNGSYVGDYTTQPPPLRPVVKRHHGLVLGIAVPAFIGMIAAIGLLLVCTTIAGAKKTDD